MSLPKDYSAAVSQIIASAGQRYAFPTAEAAPSPIVIRQHFTVANEAIPLQAPAWRDYVDRILDSNISRTQLTYGFRGEIDSYVLKDMVYLESRTDPLAQARALARISRDNVRDYIFHVAVEGIIETETDAIRQRKSAQFVPGILALDMNQPMRMVRPSYARVLAFFLPRSMVEAEIPDAESIHGRVVAYTSPLTRLILDHLLALCRHLPTMNGTDADHAIRTCAQLIIAAFSKQARLSNGARAAAQAAMFGKIQRYIQDNLYQKDLSPEYILLAFPVSRPTLYRMFEREGGLAAYIRHCRLREAAAELIRSPWRAISEVAYGLGFNSASDFTRAFRRAYGMAPQDFRGMAGEMGYL
ncbi:helix-turn-helix domain-containing protein [Andreprevotia chitinilytica]|uniref:helix-turn-helix domain-containing protein n=1 Tax=Andreprevotia chitinilytica TaxID=396808 RepID=UPI000A04DEBD|nr:helix-turn-helix domain-containing protein [Andreprevotia chitinilytica]